MNREKGEPIIMITLLFLIFHKFSGRNKGSVPQRIQWLSLIMGVIAVGVGIGIYVEAQLPKTPIDGLMMAISNRFSWSLSISRISIEASGAISGFLLGGPVGLGTLVTALFLGKIIQISNHQIKKILHVQMKPVETH